MRSRFASDCVADLISGFTTSEYVAADRPRHIVKHLALLDQLTNTLTGSTTGNDTVRACAPASRPAGRIDVLAFLERLQRQSRELATELDVAPAPLRQRLQGIGGAIGPQPHRVVRSWWATARVLTSFDAPAFTPNVPCPQEACERRGALRVKVDEREDERMAVCVECHAVWEGDSFGLLAMWVQWAAEHLSSAHLCDECFGTQVEMSARARERRALVRVAS